MAAMTSEERRAAADWLLTLLSTVQFADAWNLDGKEVADVERLAGVLRGEADAEDADMDARAAWAEQQMNLNEEQAF